MSVSQAKVGRQKTIASLAKAVFGLKDKPELQERAEAALLAANPGLADEDGLKPGAPIIVPDLRDPREAAPGMEAAMPPETVRNVTAGAAALADLAGTRLDEALKEATDTAKMLKNKATVAAIVAARPDLEGTLPAIAAAAEEEAKRAAEMTVKLRAALAQIEGLIPGAGPR